MKTGIRQSAFAAILLVVFAAEVPAARALTPSQSTAAAMKAKADTQARLRTQALEKVKADAAARARTDAAAKTKVKSLTLMSVRAETMRRIEAATKAAAANAQVTSFHATSSGLPINRNPGTEHREVDLPRADTDHVHRHGSASAGHAASGHAR